MNRSQQTATLAAALVWAICAGSASAQEELTITDNESQKGRLAEKSSKQVFKVVIKEDNTALRFRVKSETGNLQVEVRGTGDRLIGSWQAKMDATIQPKNKLAKGTYFIKVTPYSKTPGIGVFTLTILDPKLEAGQPVAPKAGGGKDDPNAELKQLREEVEVLRKRVEQLEKRLKEKEPQQTLKDQ